MVDEAQLEWIERFSAGDQWWSREVSDFLHNDALFMATEGFTSTILFTLPKAREVVGYVAAASASLPLADVIDVAELPDGSPSRVPAVLIPYMGVARAYQGQPERFGREIHLQLLDSVAMSWPASRFMYLECWEENESGVRFWEGRGYTPFKVKPAEAPDGTRKPLVRLLLDRFAVK